MQHEAMIKPKFVLHTRKEHRKGFFLCILLGCILMGTVACRQLSSERQPVYSSVLELYDTSLSAEDITSITLMYTQEDEVLSETFSETTDPSVFTAVREFLLAELVMVDFGSEDLDPVTAVLNAGDQAFSMSFYTTQLPVNSDSCIYLSYDQRLYRMENYELGCKMFNQDRMFQDPLLYMMAFFGGPRGERCHVFVEGDASCILYSNCLSFQGDWIAVEDLMKTSSLVVLGTIQTQEPKPFQYNQDAGQIHGVPFDYYNTTVQNIVTISVDQVLSGECLEDTLVVFVPHGEMEGSKQDHTLGIHEHFPEEGEQYLFFLSPSSDLSKSDYSVTGFHFGMMEVKDQQTVPMFSADPRYSSYYTINTENPES